MTISALDHFKPMGSQVLIREQAAENTPRSSGIVIPETVSDNNMMAYGTILACGPGARYEDGTVRPMSVQPGDEVLFNKLKGSKIDLDGETLILVSESHIAAVIE